MTSRKKLKIPRRELRDSHNRGYTSRLVGKIAAAVVIMPALALTLANWDGFYSSKKTSAPRKGLEQNITESKNSYKPQIIISESIGYNHELTESETLCVLPHTKVGGLFGVSDTEISGQLQSNCPLSKDSGLIETSRTKFLIVPKILIFEISVSEKIIDNKLINRIIYIESKWNKYAKSNSGARGLMQLTQDAWEQVEPKSNYYKNVFNPRINKEVGTKYLEWINDYCEDKHPNWKNLGDKQKIKIVLAAYNGGPTKLKKVNWDISKMPCETRNYIKKIERINF